MGTVSFVVTRSSERSLNDLWASLLRGGASGWPFLKECARVERGAPVLFDLPAPDGGVVRATGRILDVSDRRVLTLAQETPWLGSVRMTLEASGSGTTIDVWVSMDEAGIAWLVDEKAVFRTPANVSHLDVRVGLLVSLAGTASVMGRSIVNAATLAAEELISDGAFGHRPVTLMVEDERTDPRRALSSYLRLTEDHRCDVVLTSVSSASLARIRPTAVARRGLVLNTALAERHPRPAPNFFELGESPVEQLMLAMPHVMTDSGTSNWYLAGNDYVWPRTMAKVARQVVEQYRGRIAGIGFTPLGSSVFSPLLDDIETSGADVVLSSFVGEDAIRFEREFYDRGLRASVTTLATNFDASLLDHLGTSAASGIWTTSDYLGSADRESAANATYRDRFGEPSAPLTGMARAAYEGVHLFARAAAAAGTLNPDRVAEQISTGRLGNTRTRQRTLGGLAPASLARVTSDGFQRVLETG